MDTILLFMLPAGLWAQDAGVAATTAAPDATAGALGRTCYRTQHRMDATCRHAGILHATGIRTGRSRVHPYQEHGQRADEKFW